MGRRSAVMDRGLFIFCIPGISEYVKKVLFQSHFSLEDFEGRPGAVGQYLKIGKNFTYDVSRAEQCYHLAENFLERADCHGFCHCFSSEYPFLLGDERHLPFGLMFTGSLDQNWNHSLTAVGTRRPTGESRQQAYRFGLECGLNGVSVVSGLAYGLDQAVMQGCLDGGGRVIGVLGCGLDVDYPHNAGYLKQRIISQGGLLISQFLPSACGMRYNFPIRNQVLALLTRFTVVFQAGIHSGALGTAGFALDGGRDVYVHGSARRSGRQFEGSSLLCDDGASEIDTVAQLIEKDAITVHRVPYSPEFELQNCNRYRYCEAWYVKS
jgi:DNA protecting protein DprA